jgi:cephalosporin-C deacetylase-like acetyl esterase
MSMWGGSYGGQVQFAAAALDARVDTINPQITASRSCWPGETATIGAG